MELKVGILGASGYVGNELVKILSKHPKTKLTYIGSKNNVGQSYNALYPHSNLSLQFASEDLSKIQLDVLFMATPHEFSASFINDALLKRMKIIDLSADFRLKNLRNYELYYHFTHPNEKLVKEAVYGLSELYCEEIKKARLVANAGCYTTCSILSLYPVVKEKIIDLNSIIIDAKSGISGAGRGAKIENLFCEVNENFKAYAIASHRHTPEIEEQLSLAANEELKIQFTPHLVPMQRGILASIYANLACDLDEVELRKIYEKYYKDKLFIRLLPEKTYPQTHFVSHSNFMDINFCIDKRTKRLIIIGALDNLVKGAAGQAVQNMNLMFDFEENLGL
ncbi:N-acetyl-gamma-glutamyl-phosphate reductase [Campylobacter upsaliensis]|uniref:N-acetyl-gamma-glutamyl-phosphate reductase n=1 Tax=Campylobacter upsaliensis TaxID=28080 RepID=UPI001279230E|nr:N-acetyl-gamma-glutamyl-phosphate reductase [Campylobacter upsaliensis]EAJ7131551.1 N-acetyl-gamma-glutamyl-phosphate reductase [Campylobacter upsaliensis]EAK0460142.1 N-acetyl-gamma-glutamyl-phosphate reductase [Campylobacter upsaliensis]EAK2872585.1 N-acetyl-gamma-glutamyl-phosphate reductase [Campylobacter upsaliensis]EAK6956692.1 N-acetyl-gamma-glutamyl-phosphate reductase [Campylobacter upsaliensis]EAL3930300.1 N-acetyl-gamma-glutamyl-phosphate reductase [Campylobacter upsaliensis]